MLNNNRKLKVGDRITSEDRGTAIVKAVHKNGYLLMMISEGKELGEYKASFNIVEKYFYITKLEQVLK